MAKLWLIYLYTGMRWSELFGLKKENIFLNADYMIGGSKTEAGKDRLIPIHREIKPLIEYLFSNYTNTRFCDKLMSKSTFYARKKELTVMRIIGHADKNITHHYTIKELPILQKAVDVLFY